MKPSEMSNEAKDAAGMCRVITDEERDANVVAHEGAKARTLAFLQDEGTEPSPGEVKAMGDYERATTVLLALAASWLEGSKEEPDPDRAAVMERVANRLTDCAERVAEVEAPLHMREASGG
jgi:hypothetical protein